MLAKYLNSVMIMPMPKADIHPKYHAEANVTCACGNSFKVGATKEDIRVDICSKCHPFFTGEEKLIDTAGRAERFKNRRAKAAEVKPKKKVLRKSKK